MRNVSIEVINRFTDDVCTLPVRGRSSVFDWRYGVSEAKIEFDKEQLGGCCVCENPIPGSDEVHISVDGDVKWCGPLALFDTSGDKVTLQAFDRSIWSHASGVDTLRKIWAALPPQDAAAAYHQLMLAAGAVDSTGIEFYNVQQSGTVWAAENAGDGESIGGLIRPLGELVQQSTICHETWIGDNDYRREDTTLDGSSWSDGELGIRRDLFQQGTRHCVMGPDGPAVYPLNAADAVDPDCGGLVEVMAVDRDGDPIVTQNQAQAEAIARARFDQGCGGLFVVPGSGGTVCEFPLDCDEVRPGMHTYVSVDDSCTPLIEEWMRVEGVVFAEEGGLLTLYAPVFGPPRLVPA